MAYNSVGHWQWEFPCKLIDNYDGDTLNLELDLGWGLCYYRQVRLHGVDTPELRGGTPLTKAAAKQARDFVNNVCRDAATLSFLSEKWSGKFGRAIGDVLVNGQRLSEMLIENRLGVRYDGTSNRDALWPQHEANAQYLADQRS